MEANIQKLVAQYQASKIAAHVQDHIKARRGWGGVAWGGRSPHAAGSVRLESAALPSGWNENACCPFVRAMLRQDGARRMKRLQRGSASPAGAGGGAWPGVLACRRAARHCVPDSRAHPPHLPQQFAQRWSVLVRWPRGCSRVASAAKPAGAMARDAGAASAAAPEAVLPGHELQAALSVPRTLLPHSHTRTHTHTPLHPPPVAGCDWLCTSCCAWGWPLSTSRWAHARLAGHRAVRCCSTREFRGAHAAVRRRRNLTEAGSVCGTGPR